MSNHDSCDAADVVWPAITPIDPEMIIVYRDDPAADPDDPDFVPDIVAVWTKDNDAQPAHRED